MNAIVNAKIMSKKLQFGPKKCYNIHIGQNTEKCSCLKVHETTMKKKSFETYLGDVICSSGTNAKNIEQKPNLGVGTVSQICSMLRLVWVTSIWKLLWF